MNLLACLCPALVGCVWEDTVSLAQKQLGAEERRDTSPSTWPGDGPGDQGHLPTFWLLPCASACGNTGLALPTSLPQVWMWPGAAPSSLPSFPATSQAPSGLFMERSRLLSSDQ